MLLLNFWASITFNLSSSRERDSWVWHSASSNSHYFLKNLSSCSAITRNIDWLFNQFQIMTFSGLSLLYERSYVTIKLDDLTIFHPSNTHTRIQMNFFDLHPSSTLLTVENRLCFVAKNGGESCSGNNKLFECCCCSFLCGVIIMYYPSIMYTHTLTIWLFEFFA